MFLHLGLLFSVVLGVLGRTEDGYGVWHRTLTPFQAHACDGDVLQLECTPSTVISVHYVSYGRRPDAQHLCPGKNGRAQVVTAPCDASTGALQEVHRRCHKSTNCRILIGPSLFGRDSCPGTRKYIEVVYKCRPEEFLNKIVCQGSQLDLFCPPGHGLTVYSASYGTTRTGAPECGQPEGTDDCVIPEADTTLRSLCSGRQNCSLMTDDRTFGNPGCRVGNKYLKVAYNCVEKHLLLPTTRRGGEEDSIVTTSFPAWARGLDLSAGHRPRGVSETTTEPPSRTSSADMQSDEVPADHRNDLLPASLSGNQEVVGFMSDWVAAHKHVTGNKEKLILYVSISLVVGFLAFVSVLGGRYVVTKLESRRSSRADITPNPQEDPFFGEHVLDHYDPPRSETPPPPPPLPTTSSFRKDSEVTPRAPVNTGADLNHYFS